MSYYDESGDPTNDRPTTDELEDRDADLSDERYERWQEERLERATPRLTSRALMVLKDVERREVESSTMLVDAGNGSQQRTHTGEIMSWYYIKSTSGNAEVYTAYTDDPAVASAAAEAAYGADGYAEPIDLVAYYREQIVAYGEADETDDPALAAKRADEDLASMNGHLTDADTVLDDFED